LRPRSPPSSATRPGTGLVSPCAHASSAPARNALAGTPSATRSWQIPNGRESCACAPAGTSTIRHSSQPSSPTTARRPPKRGSEAWRPTWRTSPQAATASRRATSIRASATSRSATPLHGAAGQEREEPGAASLGQGHPPAVWGRLKPDALPLENIANYRKKACELVDKVNFDAGPSQGPIRAPEPNPLQALLAAVCRRALHERAGARADSVWP
jgi:hypothetical protein